MKSENLPPFESLDTYTYIRYIELAEMVQDKGLHTDKSVIQLAKLMYEKEYMHESKIN